MTVLLSSEMVVVFLDGDFRTLGRYSAAHTRIAGPLSFNLQRSGGVASVAGSHDFSHGAHS
jgi:hypothetical protein